MRPRPANATPVALAHSRSRVIGVDLGGTKVAMGLVSPAGDLAAMDSWPTQAADGAEGILERLVPRIRALAGEARRTRLEVVGVGLATPGIVDSASGVVRYATPTLPGWTGLALGPRISASTGLAVVVHNDGHAAARGEWALGGVGEAANAVVIALGTGVGGGIIADGRLLPGHLGGAGRLGHLSVEAYGHPCWCGSFGCLEQYASGPAIVRAARAAITPEGGPAWPGRTEPLTAGDIIARARAGDAPAAQVLAAAGQYLGAALASLVNVLSPEVVIITGGLAEAGPLLLGPAEAVMRGRLPPPLRGSVELRRSVLGSQAAVAGAGLLAWEHLA